jgi:hypothetical protein
MQLDDVGHDPEATAESIDDVEILARLEAQGFERITLVRAWAGARESNVSTLLKSPDGAAFGESERKGSLRETWLRSMLQDGTIVETRLRRSGWMQVLMGPLRIHHPRAHYHLAQTAEVEQLWPTHSALVERIALERRSSAVPCQDLQTYRDLTARALRVSMVQWQGMMLLCIVPVFVAMFLLMPGGEEGDGFDKPLLYASVAAGLLVGRLFGRRVATLLPWPRR